MALKRVAITGNGQLEPNHIAGLRSGAIEAQCKIASTDTSTYEVGMLVAVDKAKGTIAMPTANGTLPLALLYNSEQIYNQFTPSRRNFTLSAGDYGREVALGKLDTFTTNTLAYDSTEFTTDAAFWTAVEGTATTALYGTESTLGAIAVSATKSTTGMVFGVSLSDTPDGQKAIKFSVEKEG